MGFLRKIGGRINLATFCIVQGCFLFTYITKGSTLVLTHTPRMILAKNTCSIAPNLNYIVAFQAGPESKKWSWGLHTALVITKDREKHVQSLVIVSPLNNLCPFVCWYFSFIAFCFSWITYSIIGLFSYFLLCDLWGSHFFTMRLLGVNISKDNLTLDYDFWVHIF